MKKYYDKLVRDRIPEVIEASGKKYSVRQLTTSDLKEYAFKKLREEVEEFIENPSADEAADVMEVMSLICNRMGLREQAILAEAIAKRVSKGGFQMGFILEWVEEE